MLTVQRATLIVDLDHVPGISRQLGADAGEELIWFAAWRITDVVRDDGAVNQASRGQFKIALYAYVDETTVHQLSARLHASLRAPFTVRGREIFTSASIGVGLGVSESAESLQRSAVEAMRRVKANGGDATFMVRCASSRQPYSTAAA